MIMTTISGRCSSESCIERDGQQQTIIGVAIEIAPACRVQFKLQCTLCDTEFWVTSHALEVEIKHTWTPPSCV